MKVRIEQLLQQIKELKANNVEELEALRIKYLSKKGEITALFADFRNVPNEEKREIGQLLNELKNTAQTLLCLEKEMKFHLKANMIPIIRLIIKQQA